MQTREIHIATQDNYQIAATLFTPSEQTIKATVIVCSATGVLRQYYKGFASFLAEQGLQVITYDYRGIGGSRTKNKKDLALSMVNWGRKDYAAIVDYLSEEFPDHDLLSVGHSIGGQLLGLLPDNHRIKACLNIASQHVYWKNWSGRHKALSFVFFYGLLPFFARTAKGLPAWVLGAEPLPLQITRDWSRFGRKSFYTDIDGKEVKDNYFSYRGKMRLLAVEDDLQFAPTSAVYALKNNIYRNADAEVLVVKPSDYEMKRIDHFGFFQKRMNRSAWKECADWLKEQTAVTEQAE